MKRTLIIMSLAALLVMPLILVGCGGGATLTESDVATIRGFGARLDSHDQSIATINNTLNTLDTETLNGLAALDAAELTALLGLSLSTVPADVTQLKTDMAGLKNPGIEGSLPDLVARVEALENDQSGGSDDDGTTPGGGVTVTLDVDEDPFQFMSGVTATSQVFPVKITNGTDEYQQVTYNITLRCVSTDHEADVVAGYSMMVNTIAMGKTPVPAEAGCQWIYFLWIDSGSIPVTPGKTVTVYTTLNDFATSSGYEVWEVTLVGVTATEL